jgi:hypothetical protein
VRQRQGLAPLGVAPWVNVRTSFSVSGGNGAVPGDG